MYKLYWDVGTGAFVVQALLEEAGARYERIAVSLDGEEQRAADYLAVNPMAQIPTLILPDGTVMTESAAIVLHLADAHPEAGLAPRPGTPARARFDRWLLVMATNLYETCLRVYDPDRYTADPAGEAAVSAAARAQFDRGFDLLEREVLEPGPHVLGEAFSALDPYLAMLAWWHKDLPALLARSPRVARICESVRQRPAIAPLWPTYFPKIAAEA